MTFEDPFTPELRERQLEYCEAAAKRIFDTAEDINNPIPGLICAGVMAELKSMFEVGMIIGIAGGVDMATHAYDDALHTERGYDES